MKLLAIFACAVHHFHVASAEGANPVRRVVDLLVGLKAKCEKDLKDETAIFESYECWYKNIMNSKGASNDQAQSRIDSLTSYIEDIDAGRIEFTSERKDLETQIKGLKSDLEQAKTLREQEKTDFAAADKEMETAIEALDEAITVLEEGTEEQFLQASNTRILDVKWSLRKALQVGRNLLTSSDAKFLESILDGDKPTPDWKKLNRKATFKMKYSARSKKIIKTLKSMQQTFEKNREAAKAKEEASVKEYEDLKTAKEEMLATAETALTDMTKENGARGLSKDDAQKEIDALSAQIDADKMYVAETESAYKTKNEEWTAREKLRQNEILAFSKALEVLHSDDARDLFKKSYQSQGYSFMQTSKCRQARRTRANALTDLASAVHDPRVALLATVADVSGIDKVIESIDKLVATLEEEEGEDLENKENCESELADNYGQARLSALRIDTSTEDADRAKTKVEEINQQIKERKEGVKDLQAQLKAATNQRAAEKARFEVDKHDDQKAIELIEMASEILKKWEAGGAFTQFHQGEVGRLHMIHQVHPHHMRKASVLSLPPSRHLSAVVEQKRNVPAGEAPLPPPATWDAGATYGGAQGESQGVMAIMQLIMDDIQKDVDLATQGEADAVESYKKIKADLEATIEDGEKAIETYEKERADEEEKINDAIKARAEEKNGLDAIMNEIQGLKPGCNFILVNFEVRTKKRQVEVDGLKKAKAILQGADYGKAALFQDDASSLC